MSSFNMVANHQANQVKRVRAILVKLKVDKTTKLVTNIREWNEKLELGFSTSSMRLFLDESYGKEVPKDQQVLSVHQLSVEKQVIKSESRFKKEKNFIKIEENGPSSSSSSSPFSSLDPLSSSSSSSSNSSSSSSTDEQKMSDMEKVIRKNAKKMLLKEESRRVERMIRGDSGKTTLFINPLTVVGRNETHLNPFATVELEIDGEMSMCELESEEMRMERMDAWSLIEETLSEIDKSIWRHVSSGNVYDLIATINLHFDDEEREDVVEYLLKELDSLAIQENELFKTFILRFKELTFKMEQVSLTRDGDAMRKQMKKILSSAHSPISDVFDQYLLLVDKKTFDQMSCKEILEAIEPRVTEKEKEKRKSDKAKKRKEKKEREKKKKEEEIVQVQALAVQSKQQPAAAGAVESAQSKKKKKTVEEVKGCCLHFQHNRCTMGEKCNFEHKKLTPSQVQVLEEYVKAGKVKRDERGQKGGVVALVVTKQATLLAIVLARHPAEVRLLLVCLILLQVQQ